MKAAEMSVVRCSVAGATEKGTRRLIATKRKCLHVATAISKDTKPPTVPSHDPLPTSSAGSVVKVGSLLIIA